MNLHILSNYLNQIINISLRFLLIPIYIQNLGLSAYGLIGFYITLSSFFVLLDFGMGYASIKFISEKDIITFDELRVLKFVEKVYISIAIIIFILIYNYANLIAMNFITVDDEKINVSNVIQLMSILILIVWPQSLYQSFLVAKNGFINLNVISIITNIVLSILCYLVIEHLKCGIECYFLSMIICNLFNTTALYYYSWKRLSSDFSTVCKENFVNALKRFYSNSAGASLYSVSSLLFFQLPSITLSTAATTSDLGLYGLSLTFPMALITMLNPITSVFCNKVALISTRSHAMESFVEGTLIVYVFLIAGSIILFNNIDWIYVEWLGVGNVPNEIYRLFEILLLGSTAYGMTMIVTNTFLLNEQSLKLFICYVFAVASYIIRAALEYQNIDVMRVAILWRDSAFILLLSLIVALYSYSILLHKLNLRNLCLALAIGSVYYLISNYIVVLFLFKNLAAFGVWLVIGLLIYSPVVIRMARAI